MNFTWLLSMRYDEPETKTAPFLSVLLLLKDVVSGAPYRFHSSNVAAPDCLLFFLHDIGVTLV